MTNDPSTYVRQIQAISAVPKILETVASLTGLRFVAIAHVTENSWTACAVRDELDFGLKIGDGLDVTTTLCDEVRCKAASIVIDHVSQSEQYRDHHTPRIYGFQSYFSIPILRPDGSYFGTLCGLDPEPAALTNPATVSTLELFAQLISKQLETEQLHAVERSALLSERETAELREQFIAVLGHDLRTPLGAFQSGLDLLERKFPNPDASAIRQRMRRSVGRMSALVDDVVDFTRGRMGGGIALHLREDCDLEAKFTQVIGELQEIHAQSPIIATIEPGLCLHCDSGRLSQLLSNLIKNAIVHGLPGAPVTVAIGAEADVFSISVINKGETLPAQIIGQLFKPFWRAPASTSAEGLGLGLYIVSEIARSHGGAMDVRSQDDTIRFTFSMPLLKAEPT